MVKCTQCGGSNIEADPICGTSVCVSCGFVVDSITIVSEVEFQEIGSHSMAVGKQVSEDNNYGSHYVYSGGYVQISSGDASVKKAKNMIHNIASQLNLPQRFIDMAVVFYKMALSRGLTRCRRQIHVSVSCLYITCRVEKTSHLLIDFSDITQTDVFALGRTFLFIAKSLCIRIPSVDPCLYIQRFGHKMKLGDKTHSVCVTAARLVARMKRDWIHHGRRPSGLCGAALIVSARLHGFKQSVKKMKNIVRISSSVLWNRLMDISKTPVAKLSLDEFDRVEIDTEADPPSFIRSQTQKNVRDDLTQLHPDINQDILNQVSKTQLELEEIMGIRSAIEYSIDESLTQSLVELPEKSSSQPTKEEKVPKVNNNQNLKFVPFQHDDQCMTHVVGVNVKIDAESDGNLSDVDDDEITHMLLNKQEIECKTYFWEEENGEYLRKLMEKKIKEAKVIKKRPRTNRRQKDKKSSDLTSSEKIDNSSKINYDALNNTTECDISNDIQHFTNESNYLHESNGNLMLDLITWQANQNSQQDTPQLKYNQTNFEQSITESLQFQIASQELYPHLEKNTHRFESSMDLSESLDDDRSEFAKLVGL